MTDIDPDRLDRVECRDVLDGLASLPDESVQCVVTSPPYFQLRDYGIDGQIGLEPTVGEYVDRLVEVFREIRRVLRTNGVAWLNLGDSYATGTNDPKSHRRDAAECQPVGRKRPANLKPKDLIGVPWRVAFALQADGWWLRQDIIWHKPNPMPESVRDRCTKAHEYIFLLTKAEMYFYDQEAIKEPDIGGDHPRNVINQPEPSGEVFPRHGSLRTVNGRAGAGRNKRSVWSIATQPQSEAHFATFPEALVEPCIKAGSSERGACSACGSPWIRILERTPMKIKRSDRREKIGEKGRTQASGTMVSPATNETVGWEPTCGCDAGQEPCIVLDPFAGSATAGVVAIRFGRRFIGFELNPEYAETIAAPRLEAARKGISVKDVRSGQGALPFE